MEKVILHCDLNCFFASCECTINPELKNVPMAVAGLEENRKGIILAKNEIAKSFGIQTTQTIWMAKKKCPELQLVQPHMELYKEFSNRVQKIYYDYTDLIEPFGIDECWLDVTGSQKIFGDGKTIADSIRKRIKDELDLTISVGVSFNKVFAKLGSDYKKPDATTVISKENFKEFLYPLPIELLLFVGNESQKRLYRMGLTTIGSVAMEPRELLVKALGKLGGTIWDYANGLDDSPVLKYQTYVPPKSISNGHTFPYDIADIDLIRSHVMILVEEIAMRLRGNERKCLVVSVSIKDKDFNVLQRQKTLLNPTNLAKDIYEEAMNLIIQNHNFDNFIRAITVSAKNLTEECYQHQISLFEKEEKKHTDCEKIEDTLFKIKDKFGYDSINYGVTKIKK